MDEIKEVFMFLLIGGNQIEEEQLIHMFTILADLSEISNPEDFEDVGISATTIFVEKSLNLFKSELYDDFIEIYKQELVKLENYELITYLDL